MDSRCSSRLCIVVLCILPLQLVAKTNFVIFQPDDMPFYFPESPPGSVAYPASLKLSAHDKLRSGGAVFTRAYTAAVTCAPSRFATLTGRYPSRGVWARKKTLETDASAVRTNVRVPVSKLDGFDCTNNLAATLKANGYRTGIFGKWHLWATDLRANAVWNDYAGLQAGVKSCGFDTAEALYVDNIQSTQTKFSHNSEWIAATAVDFIKDAKQSGKPFFAYVNPTSPHSPSVITALNDFTVSQTPAGTLASKPIAFGMDAAGYRQTILSQGSSLSSGDTGTPVAQTKIREQVTGTLWADGVLGAIFNALETTGQLDDTLVISQMDHGVGERNTLKEGAARIYLAAHWPAKIKPGTKVNAMVSTLDLQPTFLEIAGVTAPDAAQIDGRSWLSLLKDGATAQPRTLFVEDLLDRSVILECDKLIDLDANSQVLSLARFRDFRAVSSSRQQQYNICSDKNEKSPLTVASSLTQLISCHDSRTEPTKDSSFTPCAGKAENTPSPVATTISQVSTTKTSSTSATTASATTTTAAGTSSSSATKKASTTSDATSVTSYGSRQGFLALSSLVLMISAQFVF